MTTRRMTGSILALAGGVGLATGVSLTWAVITVDVRAFAAAMGIDPALVTGLGDRSRSLSGPQIGVEARWVFAMGVIVVVLGLALLVWTRSPNGIAMGIVVAGSIGTAFVVYDVAQLLTQKDEAIREAIDDGAPQFEALGVDVPGLADAVEISLGTGIWLCAIGGVISIVGGATVLSSERAGRTIENETWDTTPSVPEISGAARADIRPTGPAPVSRPDAPVSLRDRGDGDRPPAPGRPEDA